MAGSESIIDEVREATDIVELIGQYVRLTRKGANYFGLCPFHAEKTPSFSVSPEKQIYYCFGCGSGGNVYSFLMNHDNMSFSEALHYLADRAHISIPENSYRRENPEVREKKKDLLALHKQAALYFHRKLLSPEGKEALSYLIEKRALNIQTITHFGLGYAPMRSGELYRFLKEQGFSDELIRDSGLITITESGMRDKFSGRVIFPIMDAGSRVVGFGGRVMDDRLPKYLNSPETLIFDKSSELYALNFARKTRKKFLILCEGYLDVIALHQAGFDNAVASLGTALNEKHARLLARYTHQVYLAQDIDEAGVKAKLRSFPILHNAGLNVKVVTMRGAKDPDEYLKTYGAEAYDECLRNADNAFLFSIEELRKNFDLSDPAERTSFYRETADELTLFTDPVERNNYIDSVSARFMIPRDELMSLCEERLPAGDYVSQRFTGAVNTSPGRTVMRKRRHAQSGYEMLIASCLIEKPGLKEAVMQVLAPESFSSAPVRDIISTVGAGSEPDFTFLMNKYAEDSGSQAEIAAIMAGRGESSVSALSDNDMEKALTEAVRAVKSAEIERRIAAGPDVRELSSLLREKDSLPRLRLSL